ncbi:hypothetical protein J6590_003692 [Homalodisca vitripennis]|nr:hypothetical protein J6590_003692 [Homalodisca vitripennis]
MTIPKHGGATESSIIITQLWWEDLISSIQQVCNGIRPQMLHVRGSAFDHISVAVGYSGLHNYTDVIFTADLVFPVGWDRELIPKVGGVAGPLSPATGPASRARASVSARPADRAMDIDQLFAIITQQASCQSRLSGISGDCLLNKRFIHRGTRSPVVCCFQKIIGRNGNEPTAEQRAVKTSYCSFGDNISASAK